jgi:hypothetical protein
MILSSKCFVFVAINNVRYYANFVSGNISEVSNYSYDFECFYELG